MVTKISLIFCVLTILLVNINVASSLDISPSVERVRRAILSDNPAAELNSIITRDLSRSTVQSYFKSIVPEPVENLQRTATKYDLLEVAVRRSIENPNLRRAVTNGDVQSILDEINVEVGTPLLVISNDTIVVNYQAVTEILRNLSQKYIQQELYPSNFYLQIVAESFAQKQIETIVEKLKVLLADKQISVELVKEVGSLLAQSNRVKRDVLTDLIIQVLRPQIATILLPIQTEFNLVVNNVTATLLGFYTATQPGDPIFAVIVTLTNTVVLRVAEILVVVQTNVNNIFENLINGTVTIARRRRDVNFEDFDDFYDLESAALEISHRRVARSVDIVAVISGALTGLLLPITGNLNTIVKNVVLFLISSQYAAIGNIVTLPLRFVLNSLIDTVLPCVGCTSIV